MTDGNVTVIITYLAKSLYVNTCFSFGPNRWMRRVVGCCWRIFSEFYKDPTKDKPPDVLIDPQQTEIKFSTTGGS